MKETPTMHRLLLFLALTSVAFADNLNLRELTFNNDIRYNSQQTRAMEWYRGESVRYNVNLRRDNLAVSLPSDVVPVWKAWKSNDLSTLYINATGTLVSAGAGQVRVELTASQANVPTGTYVAACQLWQGTNYMGIAGYGELRVYWSPAGDQISYVGSQGFGANFVTNRGATVNGSPITNGAAITVSAGSATNGINSVSNATPLVGTLAFAGNILTLSITGATSSAGIETLNSNGLLITASGTNRYFTVTNSPLVGGLAASAFATGMPIYVQSETNADAKVAKTGDTITGNVIITGGQFSVYRSAGQVIFSDLTSSNSILINASAGSKAYINFEHNEEEGRITYSADSGYDTFDFSRSTVPANFTNINTIYAASFIGNGSGLTNVFTIATNGTGNVVTNLAFGGNVITQQMGTASGGSGSAAVDAEILGFSRWAGSASGWHVDSFAPSIDDVSTTTATNLDLYQHFIYSTSITTITNTIAGRFTVPVTNHFPFKFSGNQAGAVVVVSMFDGAAAKIVTQTLASASTTYTTNAPIAGGAATNFSLEFRWASTNAANAHRVGVGR